MEMPESMKAQGICLCVHIHVELSYGSHADCESIEGLHHPNGS